MQLTPVCLSPPPCLQGSGECDASDRCVQRLSSSLSSAAANITALDLSFNQLTSTRHITNMVSGCPCGTQGLLGALSVCVCWCLPQPHLVSLDVSYNNLHSLEGLTVRHTHTKPSSAILSDTWRHF